MLVPTIISPEFQAEMNKFRERPQGQGLIEACSKNIVLFAECMLGIKLYSWQVKLLTDIQESLEGRSNCKEFVVLTSRQIGKSTGAAIASLWIGVFNKAKGTLHRNSIIGIISASDEQAKKLLLEIKKLVRRGDSYMRRTYQDENGTPQFASKDGFFTDLLSDDDPNNTSTITFKPHAPRHGGYLLHGSLSGSVIKSFPPTSKVLGETFTVLIEDEAGKTDKITDEFHYEFASPTVDSTNGIRIYLSTAWETHGFFYQLCDVEDELETHNYNRYMFTINAIESENPEHYGVVLEKIGKMNIAGKHNEVQRAYYCKFAKSDSAYFDPEKVRRCFTDSYEQVDSFTGMCDMGIDFGGQVKSRTVITISRMMEDGKVQRLYRRVYDVGKDLSLIDDVEDLMKYFNVQRIIPDDCPAGDFLIRTMKQKKGWDVQPMNFRSEKIKKYGAFRSKLNREQIISFNDTDLMIEMLALEYNAGSRNSLISCPAGYSDDQIDSFLLSAYFFLDTDEEGVQTFDWGQSTGNYSTTGAKIFEAINKRDKYKGVKNCI